MTTIVEYARQHAVEKLFNMNTFNNCWPVWKPAIITLVGASPSANGILDLGDHLSDIFSGTANGGRSQSELSGGGAAWEGLVCWYLNLCLIGTNGVVIKQDRNLIPSPLRDAFTVKYGTIPSNTESDLVGIVFPDKTEYSSDITHLALPGISTYRRGGAFNYLGIINALCERDFNEFEASIIQCKTNWNDNAQIPMLWDMIYSSKGFNNTHISVGANNYQISSLRRFSYSFATMPSNDIAGFTPTATSVQRVRSLSGGNYWGRPTVVNVAASLKDFIGRNMVQAASSRGGIRTTLATELSLLSSNYSYFNLP